MAADSVMNTSARDRVEMLRPFEEVIIQQGQLVRELIAERDEVRTALIDTYADLQQMVPGMSKPYIERMIASWQL